MRALIINCSPVKNGATAEIVKIICYNLTKRYETKDICVNDYKFDFCRGCRVCHNTATCIQKDDIDKIIEQFEWADIIVSVSPSYWADVPAQFKAFIDRCTPWCNTHTPHAAISKGKKGYSVALRTGPNIKECNRIIETIEHFYGHMKIECCGNLGLCSVEYKEDVKERVQEILNFCDKI